MGSQTQQRHELRNHNVREMWGEREGGEKQTQRAKKVREQGHEQHNIKTKDTKGVKTGSQSFIRFQRKMLQFIHKQLISLEGGISELIY